MMPQELDDRNSFDPDSTLNSSDPLNAAKGEGSFYRRGLSGNYKKSPLTKIGFIFLGGFLVSLGISFFLFSISCPRETGADYVVRLIFSLLAVGLLFVGVKLFKTALKK